MCVLCHELLSNESMKSSKLRRHLESKHNEYACKPVVCFKEAQLALSKSQISIINLVGASKIENAVKGFYEVCKLIAKTGKPHTIGEDLVLPAVKPL